MSNTCIDELRFFESLIDQCHMNKHSFQDEGSDQRMNINFFLTSYSLLLRIGTSSCCLQNPVVCNSTYSRESFAVLSVSINIRNCNKTFLLFIFHFCFAIMPYLYYNSLVT